MNFLKPEKTTGDLILYNARLVDRDIDSRGAILVHDGKIESIYLGEDGKTVLLTNLREKKSGSSSPRMYDAQGAVLMPAFIDMHAHFRDPGYTQKETLETGSRAAAAGGYATVVLMANTNPVVSDGEQAREICERAKNIGIVQVFQSVSLTRNFDGKDTTALGNLDVSQVPLVTEDGKEVSSASVMLRAMEICAQRGLLVSCHCEDPELALAAKPFRDVALAAGRSGNKSITGFEPSARFSSLSGSAEAEPVRANLLSASRLLRLAENTMTARNLSLAEAAGARIHIAHISTSKALSLVRSAKAVRPGFVSCEVTPHHVGLTDLVPAIVNPPLRSEADRLSLLQGLIDGTIDAIATDHAPHTESDKQAGSPGFSGIQTAFSFCHTLLVQTGRISLSRLSALMSANPAVLLGLKKGVFRLGYDADFVLVDIEKKWTVDPFAEDTWFSLGKNTPLAGENLTGCVLATFKNGIQVYRRTE